MSNLLELHNAIAKVCPILGVADLGDGSYRIDYSPEATAEQKQAASRALETFEAIPQATDESWLAASYELNPLLAKAMSTSDTNAFSLLLAQLTTFHAPDVLAIAISLVRAGMPVDFTSEEIDRINQICQRNHIRLQVPYTIQ